MMANLMLTLFLMPSIAIAQNKDICYSQSDLHILAKREIAYEKCQLDLATRTGAYETLLKQDGDHIQLWQEPAFIVFGCSVSFVLGAFLVGSHCFGLCH